MFVDLPQNLIFFTAGAFLIGWILSSVGSRISGGYRARRRDPRDDRIRSLEADLRVAHSERDKSKEKTEQLKNDLDEANDGLEKRDNVISHQQGKLESLAKDLKESVLKTRELRSDLSDRATENIKSEVKLREVETELEVAQASTDMIATGILDYSMAPETELADDDADEDEVSKAAT